MSTPLATLLLLVGGVVAGIIGSAGGITSLVSYPTLLATGVSPFAANVVNLVSLVACWPGSAAVSRREIGEQRAWLRGGLCAAGLGSAAGTVLLLTTPASVFERVVPVLVALGALALLAQPLLTARVARGSSGPHRTRRLALLVVGALAVYNGYFGAGAGVMVLATTLILIDARMPVANAVKNMLVGIGSVTSAVVLIIAGPVDWAAVLPLSAGLFLGSLAGPVLARRLPAVVIRWTVGILGLALAVELAINPG